MEQIISVEHPTMTVRELCMAVQSPHAPIRRSTHVGNQPPHELLLMTSLPPGIEILTVDTIQGNDSYSNPRVIRLDRQEVPITGHKESKGRVVGSLAITKPSHDSSDGDTELRELLENSELACVPRIGDSLTGFHHRAIEMLEPNNMPKPMTEFFGAYPELLKSTMEQAKLSGQVKTETTGKGTVVPIGDVDLTALGVFGIDDASPVDQGAMIPLVGMMALDMLISTHSRESDATLHLAGPDMIRYTRNVAIMDEVGRIYEGVSKSLGLTVARHCYQVADITGLSKLVSTATHASQHQLLRAQNVVQVNLEQFADLPCSGL